MAFVFGGRGGCCRDIMVVRACNAYTRETPENYYVLRFEMSEIERLKTIVEKLRREDGFPWDKVQTHESLKPGCIEEAAEELIRKARERKKQKEQSNE